MSWDCRDGRRYYSRSYKLDGRTFRVYLGGGASGEQAAAEDAQRRARRQAERAEREAERQRWAAAAETLRQLCELSDLLVQAALLAAGYHRHDRGQWRYKRRGHE